MARARPAIQAWLVSEGRWGEGLNGMLLALFPCRGMCYNRPAVEHAVKPGAAPVLPEPAGRASSQTAPHAEQNAIAPTEDASRYCPVCSQRLESRRCKLICAVCGYYMSCADYY